MDLISSAPARKVGAFLVVAALVVSAAVAATSRAGSNFGPSADVTVSPHVLTAGQPGYMTIKFNNPGPSTVNHAVATVRQRQAGGVITDLPLPGSAFTSVPSGCQVTDTSTTSTASSFVTCNIGQVSPGIVRRVLGFTMPSGVTPFNAYVAVAFDESKNTALTDTVVGWDEFSATNAGSGEIGTCSSDGSGPTAGALVAEDAIQRTAIEYPKLTLGWNPCTPASAGVRLRAAAIANVAKPFGDISFVDFLDGGGLATVKVYFLTTPSGITKKNIALYELATYPNSLEATISNGTAAIPKCVLATDGSLQIPAGSAFHSCLAGASNLPGGGVVAELRAKGGTDPGWGGIG